MLDAYCDQLFESKTFSCRQLIITLFNLLLRKKFHSERFNLIIYDSNQKVREGKNLLLIRQLRGTRQLKGISSYNKISKKS